MFNGERSTAKTTGPICNKLNKLNKLNLTLLIKYAQEKIFP